MSDRKNIRPSRANRLEPLEPRTLMAVVAATNLNDVNTTSGAAATKIDLVSTFKSTTVSGTVVRLPVTVGGASGSIDFGLFDSVTPRTVANFLKYVNAGLYNDTFAHRLVKGFVLQAGGYSFSSGGKHITQFDPVVNEFATSPRDSQGRVNTRGTVAMAKSGDNPNSATSEFFINLADNSSNLDNQNGGFTTFAKVLGSGMNFVDQIAALDTTALSPPFDELPLANYSGGTIQQSNVVYFNGASVIKPVSFAVTSSDTTIVNPRVDGNGVLSLNYTDTLTTKNTGPVTISITATDLDGATLTSSFKVNIASGGNLAVFYNNQRLDPNDTKAVNFGVLKIGQSATQQLVLRNTGDAPLTLGTAVINAAADSGFSIVGTVPKSLQSNDEVTVTVGINPRIGGAISGSLNIPTTSASGPLALGLSADVRLAVTLGTKTVKSIVFKETSGGTTATLSISGAGTAELDFVGATLRQKVSGRVMTVTGAASVGNIVIKGTNAKSVFNITGRSGDGSVSVESIAGSSTSGKGTLQLDSLNAPGAIVTRGVSLGDTGNGGNGVNKVTLFGLSGAQLFIGASSDKKAKVTLSLGRVTNSTINSRMPVASLAASKWVDTDAPNAIAAPSLGDVSIGSDFSSSINLDTGGSLGNVTVKGSITKGTWSVPGKTAGISAKSISKDFVAGLTGGLGTLTTTGDLAGNIQAGPVKAVTVGGNVANFSLKSTSTLGSVTIKGTVTSATIDAAGNIGDVSAKSINSSALSSGIQNLGGAALPTAKSQFVQPAKVGQAPVSRIRSVTLTGAKKGFAFSNSTIAASRIDKLDIGLVESAPSSNATNGIAASSIGAIKLKTDVPQSIDTTTVSRASDLPQLQSSTTKRRTFVINVVTA